jgi:O-antigen ligase
MPSTVLFMMGTLLLSLNFVRVAGLAISDWLFIGAMGFALLETLTIQKKNFICWLKNPFIPLAGLIGLGAIISSTNSTYLSIALSEILQQLFVITVFVSLIWILVRRGKIKSILLAFIGSGVFTAWVAVLDYLTGSHYGPTLSGTPGVDFLGRSAGTLGHPNKLGYFLVITVLLTIGYWVDGLRGKKRTALFNIAWGCILLIQIFGIYISNSVTAYVGLIVGLLIIGNVLYSKNGYFKKIPHTYPLLLLIFGSIILIFAIPYIKTSSVYAYIQNALDRVLTTTSESRIVIYKLALDRILNNPLIGVGYDQISTSGIGFLQLTLGSSIHNALLQIFYTGGLIAFVGWLAIYIVLGWTAIKVLIGRTSPTPILFSLAAAVLSVLVMDQFQDAIYQREKWLVFGLLIGYYLGVKNHDRLKNSNDLSQIRITSDAI